MENEMLQDMFAKQVNLQKNMNQTFNQRYLNDMSMALVEEVFEALRETNHKPWRVNFNEPLTQNQEIKFKEELIDAWHFLINLSIASGMTANELHFRFMEKNKINIKRQEERY